MDGRAHRRAFTLIDLMIVIVILGILAAVVVPIVSGHVERAEGVSARTTEAMVRKALDMYFQRHDKWPAQITPDMFQPPEPVSMPRGYQLQFSPVSGELDLLDVPEADLDTAPAVVIVE